MKKFLRNIFLNFLGLFLIARLITAIYYSGSLLILFWAAVCLTLMNLLIKPILNLLLMPINLLTLGAFRWIINVIVLFLVTIFVPSFKISGFTFIGLSFAGFAVPPIRFTFFWSIILVSFLIEIFNMIFRWILK